MYKRHNNMEAFMASRIKAKNYSRKHIIDCLEDIGVQRGSRAWDYMIISAEAGNTVFTAEEVHDFLLNIYRELPNDILDTEKL
jgi:hypothetical protein